MIRILTDSGSDYLPDEIKRKQIEVVPLQVSFGNQNYLDGVDLTREEFFQMLMTQEEFPVTSQPSPAAFLEPFQKAKESGDEMICILISSALSGTFQSALTAKQMVDYDRIFLVDSFTATLGMQFLVDKACEMRHAFCTVPQILKELKQIRERIRVYFMVDTLEYLYRGGRLSRTGMLAGKLVNMKPILTLDRDGKVTVSDLGMGTFRSIKMIIKHLKNAPPDENFPLYSLFSVGLESVEKLEKQLSKQQIDRYIRKQIGGVIGAHIGPGATGVFYVQKEEQNS